MPRHSHIRAVLAAMLAVLVLAPMAAAFAGPVADPHGCCRHDESFQTAPSGPQECCYVSARPGPMPASVAPVKRVTSDVALVSVAQAASTVELPARSMTTSETTSSPPNPSICSPVLRV